MAEGGGFPWKLQTIIPKGPIAEFCRLRDPLPTPPEGMVWRREGESKEWKLVKENAQRDPPGAKRDQECKEEPELKDEEGWEVLSDRISIGSLGGGGVVVARAGSVRSIDESSASTNQLSVPFKIQRTSSASTIDSQEATLGPSGKGVLGVDYVEHVIMPTDTLQGICLSYKISATRLKQANHFSGNSLLLAPKKLVIPLSKTALRSGFIRVQDTDSKEYKMHAFQAEFPDLNLTEGKAYLELADWVLEDALRSAREDGEWEKEVKDETALKAGEIHITMNVHEGVPVGFKARGAGMIGKKDGPRKVLLKPYESTPAIATKTVQAEDVYKAAAQHNGFGVELQTIPTKSSTDSDE